MSDHDHHDPGGHELEAVNTKLLFRLLVVCGAITLAASIAVIQWFNAQKREMQRANAAAGSFQLEAYKAEMAADLEGIDRVAADIVANPALLKAPEPPPNWQHPDDLVGGAPAPAADEHPEEEEPGIPVKAPEDEPGAGDDEGEPAEDAGDEAPAEDAGDEAPADEPASDDKGEQPAKQPDNKPADKPDKPADEGDKAPADAEGDQG